MRSRKATRSVSCIAIGASSPEPLHDPVQQLFRLLDVHEVTGARERIDAAARGLEPSNVGVRDVVRRAAANLVDAIRAASLDGGPEILGADLGIERVERLAVDAPPV